MADCIVQIDTPVCILECTEAFNALTEREKLYAHYLCRASWEGGLIVLLQTSPESGGIFLLLQNLFVSESLESLRTRCDELDVSNDEFQAFLVYAASFYANMGNYKGFGDTKFVPGIQKEKLGRIITGSEAYRGNPGLLSMLWEACADVMYSTGIKERQLGFSDKGVTTYYSCNCVKSDAQLIQQFMTEKSLEPYNTRVFKTADKNGKTVYELRLASALTSCEPCDDADKLAAILGEHVFNDTIVNITRGDYAPLMSAVVENLSKAKSFAANENQELMLEAYIRAFNTGCLDQHKKGSSFWIRDKGPIVESYIGFIESYRDPFGVRGEWEGFVAMVNKEMSAKFAQLVQVAEEILGHLPWPKEFEKDKFLRPDFTSLDVLTFAGSGIPAGINIPNYDEIRQNEGFKNVSLGNVLAASFQDKRVTFLGNSDQDVYTRLKGPSFEVQVGLHELLGHGSGKHLKQDRDGKLNFDENSVINPLTGSKVTSWYRDGETYDAKFSEVSSSYEECRAECVGLYLCLNYDVLSIFGHTGDTADDIVYVNWLSMVRAGLVGLEYFTPESNKWRQAHMQARYVILRVLQEIEGFVNISQCIGQDGQPDLVISLDRSKIRNEGKAAIGQFLLKLQVYKSTANAEAAEDLYSRYSAVNEEFMKMREIVLARKVSRRIFVQPHTEEKGGTVTLTQFEASAGGVVESFARRFPVYCKDLQSLWETDKIHWQN